MTASLEYQERPRWHRRNLGRGLIAILILAASICAAVWLFRFAQQIARVHAQQQWMKFSLPPDTIVLSARYVDEQQLITKSGYQRMPLSPFDSLNTVSLIVRSPPTGLSWGGSDPHVFIHQLRSKDGPWRLVSISLRRGAPFDPREMCVLQPLVQSPATLRIGSRLQPTVPDAYPRGLYLPTAQPLRIYAGQPDPTDDSHFTIRYERNGQSDIIDGWLTPEDTVKLEPRKSLK